MSDIVKIEKFYVYHKSFEFYFKPGQDHTWPLEKWMMSLARIDHRDFSRGICEDPILATSDSSRLDRFIRSATDTTRFVVSKIDDYWISLSAQDTGESVSSIPGVPLKEIDLDTLELDAGKFPILYKAEHIGRSDVIRFNISDANSKSHIPQYQPGGIETTIKMMRVRAKFLGNLDLVDEIDEVRSIIHSVPKPGSIRISRVEGSEGSLYVSFIENEVRTKGSVIEVYSNVPRSTICGPKVF